MKAVPGDESEGRVDVGLRDRLIQHIVSVINASEAKSDPFLHFTIDGFFPDETYRCIVDRLPSLDLYEPFGYDQKSGSPMSRMRFRLENENLDRLPPGERRFWYTIRSVFGSVELRKAVFGKLAPAIARRFKCPVERARDLPGYPLPEIFRETAGFGIKPHPDTSKKIVTMQVSLARDDGQHGLGTEFYRLDLSPLAVVRRPGVFKIVSRMPYLPNTAYAFAVLNTIRGASYHGRSILTENAGVRNTLLQFWYTKPDWANRDLVRQSEVGRPVGTSLVRRRRTGSRKKEDLCR